MLEENEIMLKAGFARLDITPPFGCPLDGYQRPRSVKCILDPLYLNALALSDGEKTLVMIAADLEGLDDVDGKVIKDIIFQRLGIPEKCVHLSALHQHTSFLFKHKETGHLPAAYAEVLYAKFSDVAEMAVADLDNAALYTAEKETAEPLGFVRRYRLDDGKTVTNPTPSQIPHIVARLAEADNTVRLLRFKREGKKDIALVNFSTHPDVVHGENVSADWPGFTRSFVEADNSDVSCIFFTGAQGDSNHLDFMGEKRNGYEHSKHMGRVIADTVKEIWDSATPHQDGKLFADIKTIYNRSNTEGEEKYDECKAFLKAREEGTLGYNPEIEEVAFARRVVEIREKMTIYRPINVTVIGISDVVIVGFAGEPFTEYGAAVREAAGGSFALTFCLTNGHRGYLPSARAFAEGGYEAKSSRFTPTVQAEAIAAAKEMLENIPQ